MIRIRQWLASRKAHARQKQAWAELERCRQASLRSYATQDFIKRRAAALKGRA